MTTCEIKLNKNSINKMKGKNKKMKHSLKRLPALLLALIFALMMPMTAFASTSPTSGATTQEVTATSKADINVTTGNPQDSLALYKMIDIIYNEDTNTISYEFTKAYADYMKEVGDYNFTTNEYTYTTDDFCKFTEEELMEKIGDFATFVTIRPNDYSPEKTTKTNNSGKGTFDSVPLGQYIVVGQGSSTGARIYQNVTAKVAPFIDGGKYKIYSQYDVEMKVADASIDKSIVDSNITKENGKATANVGDTITFKVEVKTPKYPEGATNTTFFVADTPSDGISIKDSTIKVTNKNGDVMTEGEEYTVTVDIDGTVYVDFDYLAVADFGSTEWIFITYEATLNEKAVIAGEGNDNVARLVYSNSPYVGETYDPESGDDRPDPDDTQNPSKGYASSEDTEYVYTFGLVIYKYDDDTKAALSGAEFEIYTNSKGEGDPIGTITTDSNGYGAYAGLRSGTFYVIETKAPAGYKLDSTPHSVSVSADKSSFTYEITRTATEYTSSADDSLYGVQATNSAGDLLWFAPDDLENVTTNPDNDETYLPAYVKTITTTVTNGSNDNDVCVKLEIPNTAGGNLPGTGGIGVVPFIVAGSALMVGALIVLVTRRRMNGAQD
jgi:LPXTG-motif cell wall-anchored protein